jgi:D-arabinose 1-dehydrogenase-like Zn-dependent alcohol dehydrogenase
MSSSTILGYAAMEAGQILTPFYYPAPTLKDNDVRVSVTHCGVCHTDIQAIDNYYELIDYPFVPGHEIVGYVSQVGKAVSDLRVGDRVGIGWQGHSCGKCCWCQQGEVQLCQEIADSGVWTPYGGFSTSVVVDHHFAYPLPEDMPSEVAAVMMCAGISVYSPLHRWSGEGVKKLAILGLGGVGHLAVQFAHALKYEVAVISSSLCKKEQALAFGADQFIPLSGRDGLRPYDFTFDILFITAPGKLPWDNLLWLLKKRGKVILVSFPEISMHPLDLVARDLQIQGSFLGNQATMREMLSFAQEHHISPMLELMPMSQINQALKRVRDNEARYRIVLLNDLES